MMHIIHRNRVAHSRLSRIKLAPQRWMRSQKSLLLREKYLQADWTAQRWMRSQKSLLLREKGDRAAVDEESKKPSPAGEGGPRQRWMRRKNDTL